MIKRMILNVLANNRVGIVASIANALAELSADLQEISQSVIQDCFSATLAVEFPVRIQNQIILDHLTDACRAFQAEWTLRPASSPTESPLPAQRRTERFLLILTGEDKPGMLRHVSSRMAREGIDIADLYAVRNDDSQRFVIAMELDVPLLVPVGLLERELQVWAATHGVHMLFHRRTDLFHDHSFPHTREARHLAAELTGIEGKLT